MDDAAKRVLRILKQYIIDNLCNTEFPHILDYLENEDVLTNTHVQVIQAERTDNGKISKLLYILSRRGPHAFQALVESLRPDCNFIADRLQAEYDKLNTEDGILVSSSQDSLPSLEESQHLCDNCQQDISMDSNCNLYSTANQIPVSGEIQPIKVDKSVSTETANQGTGINGPCDLSQPMEMQDSEFMRRMKTMWTESLNCICTKLKSHLAITNTRELSFQSPEPVTFDTLHHLLDQLIGERENCFRALHANDRHSLLTHVISLKDSKKDLEKALSDAQDQRKEYIRTLMKEQNKSRYFIEQVQLRDLEIRKLQEDKEQMEGNLAEKEELLTELNVEVDGKKEELENTATKLSTAEEKINRLRENLRLLQQDHNKLSQELNSLKGHGSSKRFGQTKGQNKTESPRNGSKEQFVIFNTVAEETPELPTQRSNNNQQTDMFIHPTQHDNTKPLKGTGVHTGSVRRGHQYLTQYPRKSTLASEPGRPYKGKTAQHQTGRQRINGREYPSMPLASLGVFGSSKK